MGCRNATGSVSDHCRAVDLWSTRGVGEVYNVSGGNHVRNIDLTKRIKLVASQSIQPVTDRPGDRRYSLDTSKLQKLGWRPTVSFDAGLRQTVAGIARTREWRR